MSTQKAVYYPSIILETTETRFGARETNNPTLYDTPIKGRTILKIDTLDILRDIWGDNILMSRKIVYKIVSGNVTDLEYRKLLCSYYIKYSSFGNYVNEKYIFGDQNVPLIKRLVSPVRNIIDLHTEEICRKAESFGGKFLMSSHDYVYFSFSHENLPTLRGSSTIC